MSIDPNDFTNAAIESGESVSVYNPNYAIDTDYGSATIESLGSAASEFAIIQPESESRIQRSEGRLLQGDLFAMFISSSVVKKNSIIEFNNKRYKVKNLIEIRPEGVIHHFEANLEFSSLVNEDTPE